MNWYKRILCWIYGHNPNYFAWRFEGDEFCWRCWQKVPHNELVRIMAEKRG